jgi:hypothetical protein
MRLFCYLLFAVNFIDMFFGTSCNLMLGLNTYPKTTWVGKTFTDNTTYSDYESSGLDLTLSGKVLTFMKHE